jgi:hypothetical protein
MVVGNKNFGVVSHFIVGGSGVKILYFSTPMTAIPAFSETDVWIYSIITLCCR